MMFHLQCLFPFVPFSMTFLRIPIGTLLSMHAGAVGMWIPFLDSCMRFRSSTFFPHFPNSAFGTSDSMSATSFSVLIRPYMLRTPLQTSFTLTCLTFMSPFQWHSSASIGTFLSVRAGAAGVWIPFRHSWMCETVMLAPNTA